MISKIFKKEVFKAIKDNETALLIFALKCMNARDKEDEATFIAAIETVWAMGYLKCLEAHKK